jgi:transcriptional regulator with XRE-family HTH domain
MGSPRILRRKKNTDLRSGGARLRDWRESAGLSQGALADMVGLTQPELSRVELGDRRPTIDQMFAIEKVTKNRVSVDSWKKERQSA